MPISTEFEEHTARIDSIEEELSHGRLSHDDTDYLIEQARMANRLRDAFDGLERSSNNLIRFLNAQNETLTHENKDLKQTVGSLREIIDSLVSLYPEEVINDPNY